jgi:hypothetical protein
MPPAASRSRFGVRFTRLPYALIACAAWSSLMIKRMFGRWSTAWERVRDRRMALNGRSIFIGKMWHERPEDHKSTTD